MIERKEVTYVKFFYPGLVIDEIATERYEEEVTPQNITLPNGAYGFQTYKVQESTVEVDGESFVKRSDPYDRSGVYYPGGKLWDMESIKAKYGEQSSLYFNVSVNGYQYAVERPGGFSFFTPDKDVILP